MSPLQSPNVYGLRDGIFSEKVKESKKRVSLLSVSWQYPPDRSRYDSMRKEQMGVWILTDVEQKEEKRAKELGKMMNL